MSATKHRRPIACALGPKIANDKCIQLIHCKIQARNREKQTNRIVGVVLVFDSTESPRSVLSGDRILLLPLAYQLDYFISPIFLVR
jgi:hypothetical protein